MDVTDQLRATDMCLLQTGFLCSTTAPVTTSPAWTATGSSIMNSTCFQCVVLQDRGMTWAARAGRTCGKQPVPACLPHLPVQPGAPACHSILPLGSRSSPSQTRTLTPKPHLCMVNHEDAGRKLPGTHLPTPEKAPLHLWAPGPQPATLPHASDPPGTGSAMTPIQDGTCLNSPALGARQASDKMSVHLSQDTWPPQKSLS